MLRVGLSWDPGLSYGRERGRDRGRSDGLLLESGRTVKNDKFGLNIPYELTTEFAGNTLESMDQIYKASKDWALRRLI